MIKGIVTSEGEIEIALTVRGPNGRKQRTKAVIDTGFNDFLTLPASVISAMDWPWRQAGQAELADGNEVTFDIFDGTVIWDRRHLRVPIYQADTIPLVGTALLNGYELNAKFEPRGKVTIRRLRRRRRP